MTMRFDAILVPGGGLDALGKPYPWVMERLQWAANNRGDATIVGLSGFTAHRAPPRDELGFPITEAGAAARYLCELRVAPEFIATETSSIDTIGNAFFSRVIHAEPRGWRRLTVVTSKFHLERTRAIFEDVYSLPLRTGVSVDYTLEFVATSNRGVPEEELSDREAREARSLASWRETWRANGFTSLAMFHQWLFSIHACYAANRNPERISGAAY